MDARQNISRRGVGGFAESEWMGEMVAARLAFGACLAFGVFRGRKRRGEAGIIWPAPLLVFIRQTTSETACNRPSGALIFWRGRKVSSYTAGIREVGVARQVGARCQTFAINRQDSPARGV